MGLRRRAVRMVNQFRRDKGLDPLRWNRQLSPYAREHSEDMAAAGDIFHSPYEEMVAGINAGAGEGEWDIAGENIGYHWNDPERNARQELRGLFKAFRRSDEHRRNMKLSDYTRIGVGLTRGDDGGLYVTYWFYG